MNKDIKTTIAVNSGDADVYGWAVGHHFDIAEILYIVGEHIPASWGFSPSPFLIRSPQSNMDKAEMMEYISESLSRLELLTLYRNGQATGNDFRHVGNVLSRYCALLIARGLDY